MQRLRALVLLVISLLPLAAAEIGPASTAVVINADSPASGAIARAWMRLRGVPDQHAVELSGLPAGHRLPLADFRTRILDAVEAVLVERGLAGRISLIAYGPDLPTAIDFTAAEGAERWQRGPGSITGLTLLAPLLDLPSTVWTAPRANPYAEQPRRPGHDRELAAAADPRARPAYEALAAKDYAVAQERFAALAVDHPAPTVLYNLACLHALAGALDQAEADVARAADAGWMDAKHTEADEDLVALRTRPAWAGLLERIRANAGRIEPDTSPRFRPLLLPGATVPGRLAMTLAVLGPRGLTADEAGAQLAASVAADGTAPRGTVWFMASGDQARTGPRRWGFAPAAAALVAAGVAAEAREGVLPPAGAEVAGLAVGAAGFDWPASGARILPGAWCDHFTSLGGALQPGAGQTPLTVFLRGGAAGAGGAVAEPYNLAQKFPSAFVHLHRVRGLTLVEAVHRTVSCPYQYLVVGDPLSQLWPE